MNALSEMAFFVCWAKKQKKYFSSKKKRHTIKTQVVIDLDTLWILFIEQAAGSVHDFMLYKSSVGSAVSPDVKMKTDSGYQGMGNGRKKRFPFNANRFSQFSKQEWYKSAALYSFSFLLLYRFINSTISLLSGIIS